MLIMYFCDVWQVLSYQTSGIKLGTLKSANETLTRAMVYVCLMALYCLGGSKVKAVSTNMVKQYVHVFCNLPLPLSASGNIMLLFVFYDYIFEYDKSCNQKFIIPVNITSLSLLPCEKLK